MDGESSLRGVEIMYSAGSSNNCGANPKMAYTNLAPVSDQTSHAHFSTWYIRKLLPFSEHHRLSGVIKQNNEKL